MKLGLCIVGCGSYAHTVMTEIHHMTDQFDFYFASRDLQKAKSYSQQFGGTDHFGNYQEALADERIHAAYFFTPHHVHPDNAQLAAHHRKHILIEKPIANSIPEAHSMAQVARDAGITLMIAENYRFLHTATRAKSMIDAGNIGKLRLINIQAEGFRAPQSWRNNATLTGGGSFIDAGIHYVDILLNLAGFPQQVYAAQPPKVHTKSQGEDGIAMIANLPNNAVGIINFSRATSRKQEHTSITISGTEGTLTFTPYGSHITYENTTVKRTVHLPAAHRGAREMTLEFKASIDQQRKPTMSAHEATKDLAIVLAAYQSAHQAKPINPATLRP